MSYRYTSHRSASADKGAVAAWILALAGIGLSLWYVIVSLRIAFFDGFGATHTWFAGRSGELWGLTFWEPILLASVCGICHAVWKKHRELDMVFLAGGSFMFFLLASMFWMAWFHGTLPFGWALLNFCFYIAVGIWFSHAMGWLDGQLFLFRELLNDV